MTGFLLNESGACPRDEKGNRPEKIRKYRANTPWTGTAAGKFGEIADHKAAITVTGGVLAIHLKGLQDDADTRIKKPCHASINFLRIRAAGDQ